MARRMQDQEEEEEEEEEERVVSKSRPAATASSPIASKLPEMPIASGKPDSRMRLNQAHSTQRRRLKCD